VIYCCIILLLLSGCYVAPARVEAPPVQGYAPAYPQYHDHDYQRANQWHYGREWQDNR
jgi:hypothetical protein